MSLILQVVLAGAFGVSSHLGHFIHGEHHIQAPQIFRFYCCLIAVTFMIEKFWCGMDMKAAPMATGLVILIYCGALFCSILVYRIFFHRLRGFPGPRMAKMSKLWNVSKAARSNNYQLLEDLYHRYGEFVRTGPNEISIFRPEAVRALDGVGTKCSKAAWYDIMQPRVSVATTRDKDMHRKRRRIWEDAFRRQALQEYECRLLHFAEQLLQSISESNGDPINVSSLFYLYSFDVMSDLAFGKPLNMLESNEFHFTVGLLQDGMDLLGPLSPVPWLVRIGYSIPNVAQNFKNLLTWSAKKLEYRMKNEPPKRDVMSWLLKASLDANSLNEDRHWLQGDCFALIVAGSDTVASTLVSIFYHLANDPSQLAKLRAELAIVRSLRDFNALKDIAHLNAIIYESLRLHPALPSGGLRETPAEGLYIAGRYIPGNVVVSAPRYSLGRLDSCYERATEFIPERWYAQPELVKDDSGFSPFSTGRYNCIGKSLALMQLRSIVALLVTRFDITFAPSENGIAVWRDLKDQFNAHPGKLELNFSRLT